MDKREQAFTQHLFLLLRWSLCQHAGCKWVLTLYMQSLSLWYWLYKKNRIQEFLPRSHTNVSHKTINLDEVKKVRNFHRRSRVIKRRRSSTVNSPSEERKGNDQLQAAAVNTIRGIGTLNSSGLAALRREVLKVQLPYILFLHPTKHDL
jgi:hypothetical protein